MVYRINEAAYAEGRADFDNGVSLRNLVERLAMAEAAGLKAEERMISVALGFADALLDRLRGKAR